MRTLVPDLEKIHFTFLLTWFNILDYEKKQWYFDAPDIICGNAWYWYAWKGCL